MNNISKFDKQAYIKIRKNIEDFLCESAKIYDKEHCLILDIAPQVHQGAKQFFKYSTIKTADISPLSDADYIIDICKYNKIINDNTFDIVVCTEVLEHTLRPFDAINEIHRILKPNGALLMSTPFNFRIHGPLPDCWRFTEHGIRSMLHNFNEIKISQLDTDNRFLMPIQYITVAIK
jgi:ubiquinone/menaquinone biosynthesis C-methylase UbiE